MSSFINMTKSLGAYLTRALVSSVNTACAESSHLSSGFTRWRAGYERFCKRKERQKAKECDLAYNPRPIKSGYGVLPSLKRRRSSIRLRFDKKGLNIASMLSGMRMARLLSIQAHQVLSSMPTLNHQSIRTKCGRENCVDPCDYPLCHPNNERFIRPQNKLFNIYEAYWDEKNEACCDDPCKWAHPRFDDIYLKESDKANRIYQRTWYECPPRIVPKRVCCFNQGEPPEYCKRSKKDRPATACEQPCDMGNYKCPRFTDDCCCPVRDKLVCKPLTRGLTDCKKFCTPYPSFSECVRPRIKARHPIECKCLNRLTMCEFWNYWRHRFAHRTENCV